MKVTILQKGNYYCYIDNAFAKKEDWTYVCELTGGRFGFKSAYSANTATIVNKEKQIVGKISFRLFKPRILTIDLVEEEKTVTINAKFLKRLSLFPLTFQINDKMYRLEGFRGHYKILYENEIQVASFDKKEVTFFDKDVFVAFTESHLNVVLIIALSIFDDLWTGNDGDTITVDLGNLGFPRPPDKKQWRPKKY